MALTDVLLHHADILAFWKLVQGSPTLLSRTGEFAPLSTVRTLVRSPDHGRRPCQEAHTNQKMKHTLELCSDRSWTMQEQPQQLLLRHGLCEQKQFQTAEHHTTLESAPRLFSKRCTQGSAQIPAHHTLCRKTSLVMKILSCGPEICRTQRKQDNQINSETFSSHSLSLGDGSTDSW